MPKLNGVRLTLRREGTFRLKVTGDYHCGVLKDMAVKYNMECDCKPKLDRRGFLFDQVNVDNFFGNIKKTTLSCEALTMHCVEKLVRNIRKENPGCEIDRMTLTLSPEPHAASMTYLWEAK